MGRSKCAHRTREVPPCLSCMSAHALLLTRQLKGSGGREGVKMQLVGGLLQQWMRLRSVATSHDAAQLAADRGTLREVSVALARQHTDSTMDER